MEEFPCLRGPPKVFWPRLPDGYVPPTAEEIQRKKDERLNKDLAEITRILAEAIEEVQQKEAEKQEEKQPFKFRPSVASWLHLRPHQVAVPLQRVEVEAEDEKAAPTLLQADPPNSLLKKAAAVEKTNPAGPSPLEKEYVLGQHANPKEKEASEQEKAPGPPDAGPLKKKDAEESKSKSCKTATPGDTCYKAVLWAKWIGLIEHPTWYPGLKRATANRMAIQEWLHNNSQGDCHRPCDHETYPIPPSGKGKPSLFCFSVARMGPEMDTMFMQRQMGAGIFACDGHAVYSDTHVNIDGFKTTLIPSTASGVSTDKTAANSQVFMNTWNNLLTTTKWYEYDFIAKVDPDCVFFPARLRGHVHSYVGQNVFFLNCGKYVPATMYGALEVYSKSSLGAYLSAHPRCETSFPFGAWGEDKYMTNCLEMLGCKSVVDFGNFLHDERCWGVDCGNKQAVAFHAFKQVNQWYNCWLLSNHHGFRGVDELVGQCGDPYTPYDINNTLQ